MSKKNTVKIDHSLCECVIKQKGRQWGLYCLPHNHWFKWLGKQELNILKTMDIGMIYEKPIQRLDDLPLVKFGK